MGEQPPDRERSGRSSIIEIFLVALRLGLTSFGGPVAHIGYFQEEYVERRRWVSRQTFADLVALSQSFPGAGSSKLGMSVGMVRGGLWGGVAAWEPPDFGLALAAFRPPGDLEAAGVAGRDPQRGRRRRAPGALTPRHAVGCTKQSARHA